MKNREEMVKAICKELILRQHEIEQPLETIYFGGGTPSVLNETELGQIFDQIQRLFDIVPNAEITIETNPDDLNQQKINQLKQLPINRFSIGIQSFFDQDLKLMNRVHSAQQAESSIKRTQDAGFEKITIDLIYGSPTTTDDMWKTNLQKAIELRVPHVSSYALTIEPKTILKHQIAKGMVKIISEERQQRQFEMLTSTLTQNGFEHYEISNFAKPGFHSRHNSAYWKGKHYIGIGPSAHSYDGKSRSWNVANNIQYIKEIFQNKIPSEQELLTEKDVLNELTMIGLRTVYGIDLYQIQQIVSVEIYTEWFKEVDKFISEGKILQKDEKLFLNPDCRFFADGIASDLFIV